MSYGYVLYLFGLILTVLAVLMLFPIIIAGAYGETAHAAAFAAAASATVFVGGGLVLGLRGAKRRAGMRSAVLLIVLAWCLTPVFAAIPFYTTGSALTVTDALFEAVSGLTTTGATILSNVNEQPRSVLLWRSILQWLGGLGTLLTTVGVFSVLTLGSLPVFTPAIRQGDSLAILERLTPMLRLLLPTYAILTLLCVIVLWLTGVPSFDAISLALSTISTGGFSTHDGTLGELISPGAQLVVVIFMIIGAVNFALHAEGIRLRFRHYREEPEVGYLLLLIALIGLMLFAFSPPTDNYANQLASSFFDATSFLTTTGYSLGGRESLSTVPPAFILAVCVLGGSAMSTAGGFKIIRFILLFRHSSAELRRLAHPHSVIRIHYAGRAVARSLLSGLWIYFIALTALIGFTAVIVSLGGYDFQTSLSAAATMASNAGPVFDYTQSGGVSVGAMPAFVKWSLSVAMIFGRVEILVLLPLFNRSYWQS